MLAVAQKVNKEIIKRIIKPSDQNKQGFNQGIKFQSLIYNLNHKKIKKLY